jgi:hypothetical protein
MKINKVETGSRTIVMLANFFHRKDDEIKMSDDLRQDWNMTDKDFEVLEIWIEGPITGAIKGYFQDVQADVRVSDLQDPKTVSTVQSLATLIWRCIPEANKA